MKPRTRKLLAILSMCLAAGLSLRGEPARATDTPAPVLASASATPDAAASPEASKRGSKRNEPRDATPKPKRTKGPKEIPFPVPKGDVVHGIKIPKLGLNGELLQQLASLDMKRVDDEHVVMHEAKIDLFHPDGKEDFHVILPESTLNLKTNIITSDNPVTIKTDDFELTGERMEFNTVEQTGELKGHVHMVIRNLKQVANMTPQAPAR